MQTLKKFRKIIPLGNSDSPNINANYGPEIGFKLRYNAKSGKLFVKVLGARNLPSIYGNNKTKGYFIKITLFPSKQKYETELYRDSNATINVEFPFTLSAPASTSSSNRSRATSTGEFLNFTIYAVLNMHETRHIKATSGGAASTLRNLLGLTKVNNEQALSRDSRARNSMRNRRDIGRVTYVVRGGELDIAHALSKNGGGEASTADLWRPLEKMFTNSETKKDAKGTVDLRMVYSKDSESEDDTLRLTLVKYMCSRITMQEHEKFGGSLYIKVSVLNYDKPINEWKSKPFDPTISIFFNTSELITVFPDYCLKHVKIVIKLKCTSIFKNKHTLGAIQLTPDQSEQFKAIVHNVDQEQNFYLHFT